MRREEDKVSVKHMRSTTYKGLFTVKLQRFGQQFMKPSNFEYYLVVEGGRRIKLKTRSKHANRANISVRQSHRRAHRSERQKTSYVEHISCILEICMLKLHSFLLYLLLWVSRLAGDHTVTGASGKCVLTVPQPLKGEKKVSKSGGWKGDRRDGGYYLFKWDDVYRFSYR